MSPAKNQVTTGRRSCAGASNSTGIPKKAAVEGDLKHSVSAGWTRAGVSPFVVDRVQPKWVDRFRSESATQQLQADSASIAFFAAPDDAVAGTQFRQRNATSRTKKFSVHAGMMCEVKGAVDNGKAASCEPSVVASASFRCFIGWKSMPRSYLHETFRIGRSRII